MSKYTYSFLCAIDDIKNIQSKGLLAKGHISSIAKKYKIKVKDLRVVLKDEGIIK